MAKKNKKNRNNNPNDIKASQDNNFSDSFSYKVIYVFSIYDNSHRGLLKIGDATLHTSLPIEKLTPEHKELGEAARKRIDSYTQTAGISYTLHYTELAVRELKDKAGKPVKDKHGKPIIKAFRDHDVHRILENSNIHKVKINETSGREWFRINIETAIKAIKAVKDGEKHLGTKISNDDDFVPITFRPEQEAAIRQTIKQFKKGDSMLWNAKMRFGKTLSALEVVRLSEYKKTIIVTHRPVVDEGWYEDFGKIFHGTKYKYGSKNIDVTVEELNSKKCPFVYFASIQDLRGSKRVGGKFAKNEDVFDTMWDLVIADEAHEGTQTALGDEVINALVKKPPETEVKKTAKSKKTKTSTKDKEKQHVTKFLALSGTPFNILNNYNEDSIYTWDYVMEQEQKVKWEKEHFGDSNPYAELPKMNLYTYNLGELLDQAKYNSYEDKAFNFHEFFRTWRGDAEKDYELMPWDAKVGDFVHVDDINSFLNLLTKDDDNNNYPFATEEYRKLFQHSLWIVPGVREAKALKELMEQHAVFGCGQFRIVNVAGNEESEAENALRSVKEAIEEAELNDTYTITLSCGKLTTGVTIKEWTAVFMLAGSFSTAASSYMQTIFRAQSPCNKNGKIKENAYVFDFAPDRTLKVFAEAISVSRRAGQTTGDDKAALGRFLNYMPVIGIQGSRMKEFNADNLMQQLKKAYADRVMRSGFDNANLYNPGELMKLGDIELEEFENLKKILGKTAATKTTNEIDVNDQGMNNEEYDEIEKPKKKKKKDLTPEELEKLKELQKQKKNKKNAISILRGVSIRMPLLIYGANVPYSEDITLDDFVNQVDESSWKEFMPDGVTKELFNRFKKYYDEDVFIAAGKRIRSIAREADTLPPKERIQKITQLFSNFKNPDKETVLTPWRVVNMHMSDCLGGYDFWDENHEKEIEEPRFVDHGDVTRETVANADGRILEINSKTGLYPLYVAYSIFRAKCALLPSQGLTFKKQQEIWQQTIEENIFVICKTPMAKSITQRTLMGYEETKINAHYFEDLVNQLASKPAKFVNKVLKAEYWEKGVGKMKFDAVVGNPPYMLMDGGAQASARPIYQHFVLNGIQMKPKYLSMIMPARWYAGGKGLDEFRNCMLEDIHIQFLHDFIKPEDIFSNTNIRGGICYFLWNNNFKSTEEMQNVITHYDNGIIESVKRKLKVEGTDIFIRYQRAVNIFEKINNKDEDWLSNYISPRKPFGLDGAVIKNNVFHEDSLFLQNPVKCYGKAQVTGFIEKKLIDSHTEWIDTWKVFTPYANNIGTELNDDNLNTFIGEPGTVCSETFIIIGINMTLDKFQACNICRYLRTKFSRFLLSLAKSSQHATAKTYRFVPRQDFTKQSDIDWTKSIPEIDAQLYAKYGLSADEIDFIESMIKPM